MDFDDEVEVRFDENLLNKNSGYNNGQIYEQNFSHVAEHSVQSGENRAYSNANVRTSGVGAIFQKKYIAILLSTLSIVMTLFMKFLIVCGATSKAFLGIWFFLCAGIAATSLILTVINSVKAKKLNFNVSSIITFLALIALFLI